MPTLSPLQSLIFLNDYPRRLSIYATLWKLKFPKEGDEHLGCEWIEVTAQAVPPHVGSPSPGNGYDALARIQALVLEEQDRVRITDGRGEQPDDVARVRRGDDLQAGHRHRPVLHRLRMLGAEAQPGPVGAADDERQLNLAVGHVPALGHLVGDQVPADREEVAEHDLGDRPQAGHRGAHRGAEDGLLADRGVADPLRAELLEQARGGLGHRRPRRRPRRGRPRWESVPSPGRYPGSTASR